MTLLFPGCSTACCSSPPCGYCFPLLPKLHPWYFNQDNSKQLQSLWSTSCHSSQNPGRAVDHNVLANLTRSPRALTQSDSTCVNFGLLNIRSLTNKGHLVQDLLKDRQFYFFYLLETWQQPNDFSHLEDQRCENSCLLPIVPVRGI